MPTRLDLLEEASLVASPGVTTVNGPPRRRSLLTIRSSSLNGPVEKRVARSRTLSSYFQRRPQVPMELMEHILKLYADDVLRLFRIGRASLRLVFAQDIKALTSASKDVRYLILRQFCKALSFRTGGEAKVLFDYLTRISTDYARSGWVGGLVSVRSLCTPAFLVGLSVSIIQSFANLQVLHIDASHSSLLSRFSTMSALFAALGVDGKVTPNLVFFSLTDLPCMDEHLLDAIARALPRLTHLNLSTVEGIDLDCCSNCYEESLSRVVHSPLPEVYPEEDVVFATNFGTRLGRLVNLKHLYLGLFLSHSDLLDLHTMHYNGSEMMHTVKTIPDCSACKKYEKETKRRELAISLAIAGYVRTLESIQWASAFSLSTASDDDSFIEQEEVDSDDSPSTSQNELSPRPPAGGDLEYFFPIDMGGYGRHKGVARFDIKRHDNKIKISRVL